MERDAGAQRLLRTAVFSALTVAVAAAGHELAGGNVSLTAAAFVVLSVMVVVNPMLGRRRGLPLLVPLMVTLQAGLHLAFMAFMTGGTGPASQRLGMLAEHGGHAWTDTSLIVMPDSLGSAAAPSTPGGWGLTELWSPMSLAHLFAALLLTVLFQRGEDILTATLARLGLRLPLVLWAPMPLPQVRLLVPVQRLGCPTPAAFGRVIQRRGPPSAPYQVGLLLG